MTGSKGSEGSWDPRDEQRSALSIHLLGSPRAGPVPSVSAAQRLAWPQEHLCPHKDGSVSPAHGAASWCDIRKCH